MFLYTLRLEVFEKTIPPRGFKPDFFCAIIGKEHRRMDKICLHIIA